jgi:hypothetical protein
MGAPTNFDLQCQGIEQQKVNVLKSIAKSLEVIAQELAKRPTNETLDSLSCTLATIAHEGIITR